MCDGKNDLIITSELKGLQEAVGRFKNIAKQSQKVVTKAVRAGSAVLLGAVKQEAFRERTGILKKSMGIISVKPNPKGITVGKVGPRQGFRVTLAGLVTNKGGKVNLAAVNAKGKTLKLKSGKKASGVINPQKYAHLVELGHAKGGGKGAARPFPFMIPARKKADSAITQAVRNELANLGKPQ